MLHLSSIDSTLPQNLSSRNYKEKKMFFSFRDIVPAFFLSLFLSSSPPFSSTATSPFSIFCLSFPSFVTIVEGAELYDYHKVYCGSRNCYDVLNVKSDSTITEIKTAYRALSRKYHPDHNKEKSAVGKTRLINKAYEVVGKNVTKREEYDYLLKHPEEYGDFHGHFYFEQYAPKSDAVGVVLGFLIVFSLLQWYIFNAQYKKDRQYLEEAIVGNLGFRDGGTLESIELRKKVLQRKEVLIKEEKKAQEDTGKANATSTSVKSGVGNTTTNGLSNRQKKKLDKQKTVVNAGKPKDAKDPMFMKALQEVLDELELTEGTPFKKPDAKTDLLLPQTICLPYTICKGLSFQFNWYYQHSIKKLPLSPEEELYLCKKVVGVKVWQNLPEDAKEEMIDVKVWEGSNYEIYKETKLEELQNSNDPTLKKLRKKLYKMSDAMEDEPDVEF